MKHLLLTLLALTFLSRSACVAQAPQWQKTALDSLTTVEFPTAPEKRQVQGQEVLVVNDNGALYMLLKQQNAFKPNPDSASLTEYYGGMIEGILEQVGGGKVIKKSAFRLKGFRGEEIQFTSPSKPGLPSDKFTRMVLINNTIYVQNYWASAEQAADATNRERFFNSLQTKAQPPTADAIRRSSTPYRLGYVMGQLGFIALLIGGGVLLVRTLRKPKKAA